jgi:hypothetical protein
MEELARSAPGERIFRVYFVGGGSAVLLGWRDSTIDADLYTAQDAVLRDIQRLKERLHLNVELVRPEDFVPPLAGTRDRHILIETRRKVSFYHYDPYAQTFSKIVRGFRQDIEDARRFIETGMVDPKRLRALVHGIPDSAYSRYPALSRPSILEAVDGFLAGSEA